MWEVLVRTKERWVQWNSWGHPSVWHHKPGFYLPEDSKSREILLQQPILQNLRQHPPTVQGCTPASTWFYEFKQRYNIKLWKVFMYCFYSLPLLSRRWRLLSDSIQGSGCPKPFVLKNPGPTIVSMRMRVEHKGFWCQFLLLSPCLTENKILV